MLTDSTPWYQSHAKWIGTILKPSRRHAHWSNQIARVAPVSCNTFPSLFQNHFHKKLPVTESKDVNHHHSAYPRPLLHVDLPQVLLQIAIRAACIQWRSAIFTGSSDHQCALHCVFKRCSLPITTSAC